MHLSRSLLLLFGLITSITWIPVKSQSPADSLISYQTLINGRIWRNENRSIKGDPFLFTPRYLDGSVTIGKISFSAKKLRYDIYLDEITIPHDSIALILNKELVDSFSLIWENKPVCFLRLKDDISYPVSGYVRNVYSGKSFLFIKYQKKIDRPRMAGNPDNFYQLQRMYLISNSKVYTIKKKRDIFSAFGMYETQVKDFARENKIHYSRRDPASFIPVLKYFDNFTN